MTLEQAIDWIKEVTYDKDPWTPNDFYDYRPDQAPSNTDLALSVICNAIVAGELG